MLRFTPETGGRATTIFKASVFRENGRYVLRMIAQNGVADERKFDNEDAAFDAIKPLYAELMAEVTT